MALVVQKFGGTSVGTIERIRHVAGVVARTKRRGDEVVVVVSAMGDRTDELLAMAKTINPDLPRRELDMLLTTGERQTMALLSMALQRKGLAAVSFTGSQVGIITDENHADARIVDIRGERLREALRRGLIPIVAGFQGVSHNREITTLGRGGSDTTAVALAAFLDAARCTIFTDVCGVYTENPQDFPGVKKLRAIPYYEMLELASSGAQVLHPRACALAAKYGVEVEVKSAFECRSGTLVAGEGRLERAFVRAIAHADDLCRLSLIRVPKVPKCLAQGVTDLAKQKVPLVFFAHGVPTDNRFDLSYVVHEADRNRAEEIMKGVAQRVKAERLVIQERLGSVSLVGPGVGSDGEIIARLFTTIAELGCHVDAFSTAETKITVFLDREAVHSVVSALLDRFGLRSKAR